MLVLVKHRHAVTCLKTAWSSKKGATPAGLTKQWKEEMYHKFQNLEFMVLTFLLANSVNGRLRNRFYGYLEAWKSYWKAAGNWDIVIFDEGHRLSSMETNMMPLIVLI